MIVRQFISWIRTAPAGERAEATRALARAWLISDLSKDDRIAAEGALLMLLDDPSPLVRLAMAEVFVIPELRIGYAFDYSLNKYRSYNNGTHEISVGYYFKRMDNARRTSLRQLRCAYF